MNIILIPFITVFGHYFPIFFCNYGNFFIKFILFKYLLRFNDVNDRLHYKGPSMYNLKITNKELLVSGLNNLQYKILERKNINDYVELIKVSI